MIRRTFPSWTMLLILSTRSRPFTLISSKNVFSMAMTVSRQPRNNGCPLPHDCLHMLPALNRAPARRSGPRRSNRVIGIRIDPFDVPVSLPIHLGVRINEIVQPLVLLLRIEQQVAPFGQFHAVLIVRAKEILTLRGILGRLGGIHRHSADAPSIELRPTVIAGDLTRSPLFRQWKANGKSRRYPHGARISDEDGVEIRAVPAPSVASVIDVAAAPAFARLRSEEHTSELKS